jgi:hypothetical protein
VWSFTSTLAYVFTVGCIVLIVGTSLSFTFVLRLRGTVGIGGGAIILLKNRPHETALKKDMQISDTMLRASMFFYSKHMPFSTEQTYNRDIRPCTS